MGSAPAAPPAPAAPTEQLRVMLRKHALLKRRSPLTSACELLSPALFISILVLGYYLSAVSSFPQAMYAAISLDLGPIFELLVGFLAVGAAPDANHTTSSLLVPNSSNVDLLALRENVAPLLQGPLPVLSLPVFSGISRIAGIALSQNNYRQLKEIDSYGALFGNILTLGTLHIAPASQTAAASVTSGMSLSERLDDFQTYATHTANVTVARHADEAAALDYLAASATRRADAWGLLVFNALSPRALNYSIRLNYTTVPNTNEITVGIARGLDTTYQRYITSGFLTLQRLVDTYGFKLAADHGALRLPPPSQEALLTPFPTASYEQNTFYLAVQFLLALILTMCQLFPVSLLVKSLVEEKELRLKQTMKIMGLNHAVHTASWYLSACAMFFINALISSLIATFFLPNTAYWVLLLFIGLFCLASVSFAFLLSVFFTNAILSAVCGPVVFFAMVLPKYLFFGSNRYERVNEKLAASLLAPTAFAFGAEVLGDYEYAAVGVSPKNWTDGDYSFVLSLLALAFDAVLYFLLALYLERTLPSRYGQRLHPLFFLSPTFWCPPRAPRGTLERAEQPIGLAFEPVPAVLSDGPAVEIVHLTKAYGTGRLKKTAVDDLNLAFYPGQISCLLGHNGAGKTTTLSVLTGLFPPSQGDCFVFGYSIRRAASRVYQLMGICPQHDVLWRNLTVLEHVEVYASLKGVPRSDQRRAALEMVEKVGLSDKAHARSHALSGGMRRKLSVACSLIGGSRCVLLDEPTSGMDPASRRSLWQLLKASTPGRVLVLTTHYMDEADILADRIAVMSSGKLRCAGSSLFLKARFGLGYTLTMVRDGNACASELVTNTITAHVPEAEILSQHGGELSYRLPFAAAPAFGSLLRSLDESQSMLGITGYGMSVTSMEEVFLRLSEGQEAIAPPDRDRAASVVIQMASIPSNMQTATVEPVVAARPDSVRFKFESRPSSPNEESPSPCASRLSSGALRLSPSIVRRVHDERIAIDASHASKSPTASTGRAASKRAQLLVLLRKRWHVAKRDVRGFLTQQVLPVIVIVLVLLILTIRDPRVGPSIRLDGTLYTTGSQAVDKTQLVHNAPLDHPIMAQLNNQAFAFKQIDGDSRNISRYLLDTYNDHAHDLRIGALAVPDAIAINVTADLDSLGGPDTLGEESGVTATDIVATAVSRSLLRCDALLDASIEAVPLRNALRNATSFASLLLGEVNSTLVDQLESTGAQVPPIDALVLVNNTFICGATGIASQLEVFVAQPVFIQRIALTVLFTQLNDLAQQPPQSATILALLDQTSPDDVLEALPAFSESLNCLCAVQATNTAQCLFTSELGVAGVGAALEAVPTLGALLASLEARLDDPIPVRLLMQIGLEAARATLPATSNQETALLENVFDVVCDGLRPGTSTNASATLSWQAYYESTDPTGAQQPPAAEPLIINGETAGTFALRLASTALPVQLARISASAFPLNVTFLPLVEALPILQRTALELLGVTAALEALASGEDLVVDQLSGADIFVRDFVSPDPELTLPLNDQVMVVVSAVSVRFGTLRINDNFVALDNARLSAQATLVQSNGLELTTAFPVRLYADRINFDADGFMAVGIAYTADPLFSGSLPNVTVRASDKIGLERITATAGVSVPMTIMFNASSPHGNAAMLGETSLAAWRAIHEVVPGRNDEDEPIVYAVYNHPLPLTAGQSAQVRVILAFLAGLFVLVPFCYIPAAVGGLVVKERVSRAKHLQLVSGTSPYIYWLAHYLWDMAQYTLVALATMGVFAIYAEPGFIGNFAQGAASFVVIFLYGLAAIPLAYCYTWLFTSSSTAQIGIIIFNLVTGWVLVIAHQVMQVLPNTREADAVLVHFYRFFPPFNFGQAILSLTQEWYISELLDTTHAPFASADVVRALFILPLEAILFCTILMGIEHSYTTHAVLLRITTAICGGETLGCATRSKIACALSSTAALILIIIGSAGLGGNGVEQVQTALSLNDGSTETTSPTPDPSASPVNAAILAIGAGVLVSSIALCVWYERRLRREGDTMEEAAMRALRAAEGSAFEEDDDVAAERQVVNSIAGGKGTSAAIASSDDAVLVHGVQKVFGARGKAPPKVAVVDLSLRIADGECFGFLGVNGAGKTTTISMLTGEFPPTRGAAWVGGFNVATRLKLVREQLGYCPQSDPLLDLMTARELLTMFAQLKNLPPPQIPATVQNLIDRVTLSPFADRVCGSYSGGNKRKLSLAIALIGSPRVVFLDEPSSGMDPASRRHMWDIITSLRERCAVVLTTHSMEECEALCTRLGIMSGGRFRCLGGQQHLKSKHGPGYTLELRVDPAKHNETVVGIQRLFPSAVLLDENASKFKFELPSTSIELFEIFERMEQSREELGVLDYSASQPSLESIFLNIVGRSADAKRARTVPRSTQSLSCGDGISEP